MGTLWTLRDFFETGHMVASFQIKVTFQTMYTDSLEDVAQPFTSLHQDYSNQMSQWHKIIPWNWRLLTRAKASCWEKIPWARRTQAESEWKSKASTLRRGPRSVCTDPALCHSHLTELPSLCLPLLHIQTSKPFTLPIIIRLRRAREFRIASAC